MLHDDPFPYSYEDWNKIVEKLTKEVEDADNALISISIAKECQEKLLSYAKMRLGDYPIPEIIMSEEEKVEEKEETETETAVSDEELAKE